LFCNDNWLFFFCLHRKSFTFLLAIRVFFLLDVSCLFSSDPYPPLPPQDSCFAFQIFSSRPISTFVCLSKKHVNSIDHQRTIVSAILSKTSLVRLIYASAYFLYVFQAKQSMNPFVLFIKRAHLIWTFTFETKKCAWTFWYFSPMNCRIFPLMIFRCIEQVLSFDLLYELSTFRTMFVSDDIVFFPLFSFESIKTLTMSDDRFFH
jgi:hypothetical protein